MKNVNNKSIVYSLVILTILALGLITATVPLKASAQYYDYDDGSSYQVPNPTPTIYSISPNIANIGDSSKTVTISGNSFIPGSIARWNGSNRPTTFIDSEHLLIQLSANDFRGSSGRYINVFNPAPRGGYSNAVLLSISGYIAPTTNTNTYSNTNSYDYNSDLYNTTTSNNTNYSYSNTVSREENNSNSGNAYKNLTSNAIFGSNSATPSGLIQWIIFAIIILIIVIIVRKIFGSEKKYRSIPLKHS